VGRAEAVELQCILADVQVRLDGHRVTALSQHGGRRLDEVADAVHVDDEPGGREAGALPAEARNHASTIPFRCIAGDPRCSARGNLSVPPSPPPRDRVSELTRSPAWARARDRL